MRDLGIGAFLGVRGKGLCEAMQALYISTLRRSRERMKRL
jgi:hypothetical protein